MIVGRIDGDRTFYRAHAPKWASQPLSGAGAAKHGGRLNRKGLNALYLASSTETAIAEYTQGDALMPPLTMVSYRVRLASVIDFSGGYAPGLWDPLWQEIDCNWREISMIDGREPASWVIGDLVLAAGHSGILFPSQRGAGSNLVVYTDVLQQDDHLAVHDPKNLLPQNTTAWPS